LYHKHQIQIQIQIHYNYKIELTSYKKIYKEVNQNVKILFNKIIDYITKYKK